MPLLMCPNDNSSMQTMSRSGVEFDMCPTCRGVWLDRGELEKLMSSAREDAPAAAPPQPQPAAPRYPQPPARGPYYGERGERGYGEWGEHGERGYGHGGYRKKSSIFDIFD